MAIRGTVVRKCNSENRLFIAANGLVYQIQPRDRSCYRTILEGDRVIADIKAGSQQTVIQGHTDVFRDRMSTIGELKHDFYTDVIACVTDCRPLIKTRGTDYLFSLCLTDETGSINLRVFLSSLAEFKKFIDDGSGEQPSEGNLQRYTDLDAFSKIFGKGDIVLAKNIKKMKNSTDVALMHKSTAIVKIRESDRLEKEDRLRVEILKDCFAQNRESKNLKTVAKAPNCKAVRISGIRENSYFDIVGRVEYVDKGHTTMVGITDGTLNERVESSRIGKYSTGEILYIRLYGKHSEKGQILEKDRTYLFKNVRIIEIRDSLSGFMSESLEGDIIPANDLP